MITYFITAANNSELLFIRAYTEEQELQEVIREAFNTGGNLEEGVNYELESITVENKMSQYRFTFSCSYVIDEITFL
jgi:hypothetical protein